MRLDDVEHVERWDGDPDVAAASGDDDWYDWPLELARGALPWREFLIAEEGGRPVGFVQLIDAREEEIGQEGAEFVLSSIQDGMQMYATTDRFGHSISLDDIEDFENPSVSLSSVGDGFINVDGKSVSADADFVDNAGDGTTPTAGTFEATCP